MRPAVSFVIPVHNGEQWLERVLIAVNAQTYDGAIEIIAVDDRSTDGSCDMLKHRANAGDLTLLSARGTGAAAALNTGIRAARFELVAQIDQDVVIEPDWLAKLTAEFDDPHVAASQGHYVAPADAGLCARVMSLDLRQRYAALGRWTNHVCTGNSVYRKSALVDVGLFDERLGYGYDNDVSYRLTRAGFRLAFRRDALSSHHWREGLAGYARQQYGFGYGRLDLVEKHRERSAGDNVSKFTMMLHGPVMLAGLLSTTAAAILAATGSAPRMPAAIAATLFALIALERLAAGVRAAVVFRDPAGLWFAPVHVVRDIAWAGAILVWIARRLARAAPKPSHSMGRAKAGAVAHQD